MTSHLHSPLQVSPLVIIETSYIYVMKPNVLALLLTVSYYVVARIVDCRNFPGDVDWSSLEDWMNLNVSVHGRLFSIVPLAIVCHGPDFDPEQCKALKEYRSSYLVQ